MEGLVLHIGKVHSFVSFDFDFENGRRMIGSQRIKTSQADPGVDCEGC